MNTPEAARQLRANFPELETVSMIPNGFDAEDYSGPEEVPNDNAFRIVHTGTLHFDLGCEHRRRRAIRRLLGSSLSQVDIVPRSHAFVLDAVERTRTLEPELGDRVEVHLAGVLSDADRSLDDRSFVHEHGFLAHGDAVDLMRSADLLFLPMHDLPPGVRARIVPGKTYEYLASGRPILAAVPDGDARDLLAEAQYPHLCRPTDSEAMADAIRAELNRVARFGRARSHPPSSAARFERRSLTAQLAQVFDEVLVSDATQQHAAR
jgi:glycosyltransferase involved in cell wall biosynthesis